MATDDDSKIPLELPRNEAAAFSQFVKRIDYDTCARFASKFVFYDGRTESDVMWSAVCMLQRQLAESGLAPR